MKLLYACANSASDPQLWSGTVWNCRRGLESAGVEIEVLDNIPFACPLHLRVRHALHKRLGRKVHFLQCEPEILRRAAKRIAKRFAKGDCDAVFCPGSGVPVYARLPAKIPTFTYLDATKLSWVRTYFGVDTLSARSRRHVAAVDRASLTNARTNFFSSQWAMTEAVRDYGVAAERMAVVPFGASATDPPSRQEVDGWIWGRPRDAIHLLFFGKEWERKGGPEALATVRALRSRGAQAVLHVVGCMPKLDKDERALVELHGFIKHSEPEGRKTFRALLARMHVLLFLSRAEAFGIALCEAAAFGVPMYASNTGGIPTVVRPGVNGWLAPTPFFAEAAASTLLRNVFDVETYRRLASGARDDFEKRLNWSVAGASLVAHMQAALNPERVVTASAA